MKQDVKISGFQKKKKKMIFKKEVVGVGRSRWACFLKTFI